MKNKKIFALEFGYKIYLYSSIAVGVVFAFSGLYLSGVDGKTIHFATLPSAVYMLTLVAIGAFLCANAMPYIIDGGEWVSIPITVAFYFISWQVRKLFFEQYSTLFGAYWAINGIFLFSVIFFIIYARAVRKDIESDPDLYKVMNR